MNGPRWRVVFGVLLVGAAAVFLGLTIARNGAQLRAYQWDLRWGLLIASVAALAAVLAWGVFVWKLVLDRFEHPRVGLSSLLRIWFLSNLARYIPGKIWQFVGAAELARAAGISRPVLLTSMAVHVGFSLLSAAIVAAIAMLGGWSGVHVPAVPVAAVGAAGLALVHPAVINAVLRLIPRAVHRDVLRWNGGWRDGLLLLALSVFSWAVYGLAFGLFVHAVVGVSASDLVPLTGVNALSFLVGYLVFLAPAGLGAREGAMALLLTPLVPTGVAALVAILSRLWTVVAELAGAVLVVTTASVRERASRRPGDA